MHSVMINLHILSHYAMHYAVQMLPGIGALIYELGLADENQATFIKSQAELATQYIQKGQYLEALEVK